MKKLVFHIGTGAGFYSEYLGMVFAIAYCKMNNIQLVLYSKDATFGFENGWTDYFKPFTDEVFDDRHSVLNRRQRSPKIKAIVKSVYRRIVHNQPIPKWMFNRLSISNINRYFKEIKFKREHNFDYYTFELWNEIQILSPHRNYSRLTKKYSIQGEMLDLRTLFNKIIIDTYIFNDSVKHEMLCITEQLLLPDIFIGLHIRGGDKVLEDKMYNVDDYFSLLDNVNSIGLRDLFILTDDYSIIKEARSKYPDYNIFTLCEENERGYDNNQFVNSDKMYIKARLINLFVSVELLIKSKLFIGVHNSNPDIFIDLKRSYNSFFVDLV